MRLPDGTEAGTLGGVLRTGLDAYANVRPVRLLAGVAAPIAARPGEIDYVIVRENTEGLYLSRGKGVGTDQAMADTLLVTRKGTERVARHAFELARRRNGAPHDGIKRVTCVDKSNVLASYAFFRRVYNEVAENYPDIQREHIYADAAAQALVLNPSHYDVLVMENFLGDILSDLGGATVGGIGLCPSGNIGDAHAYFEPIHGSAPDIAGQDRANPVSQVLTAALMLEHIGERGAAELVRRAVSTALETHTLVLGQFGQPEGGTRRAAEADGGDDRRIRLFTALADLAGGDAQAAVRGLRSLNDSPGDTQAAYHLGFALRQAGQPDQAAPYLEQALRAGLPPHLRQGACLMLADIHSAASRWPEAARMYREALEA